MTDRRTTPPWANGGYVGRVRARGGMRPVSHDIATLALLAALLVLAAWGVWSLIYD